MMGKPKKRQEWEFCTRSFNIDFGLGLSMKLNEMGQEGWDIAYQLSPVIKEMGDTVNTFHYIVFRRPKM